MSLTGFGSHMVLRCVKHGSKTTLIYLHDHDMQKIDTFDASNEQIIFSLLLKMLLFMKEMFLAQQL